MYDDILTCLFALVVAVPLTLYRRDRNPFPEFWLSHLFFWIVLLGVNFLFRSIGNLVFDLTGW